MSDPLEFWKYRISMAFLIAFMMEFMPLRYSRRRSVWICLVSYALSTVVNLVHLTITPHEPAVSDRLLFLGILGAIVMATAVILSRYRDWRAIFVGATASAYVLPGGMLWNVMAMATGSFAAAFAVEIFVHALFLYLFVKELRATFLAEVEHKEDDWLCLCLIPGFYYMLAYSAIMPDEDSYAHLDVNIPVVMDLIVLILASFFLLVRSFDLKKREMALAHENLMMKSYTAAIRHESESMRQKEEKYAIERHDLRHVNSMLKAYLDAGETEQARKLLVTMDDKLDETVTRHCCANVAINGILLSSAERAAHLGVRLDCHAEVPEHLEHIDDYDLGAVIANLVENAINAASDQRIPEQQRAVKVDMHMVKSQLSVLVENPYAGELAIDPRTGLPLSHGGEMHGYGLRSVQLFAEKSSSIFRYTSADHAFRVNLLVSC
jgi:signal transduction histidine kinase